MAGQAGVAGAADGAGINATFYRPFGITVAANGDVYVADTGNDNIRRITPAGIVTTVVGQAGNVGFKPGELPELITPPVAVTAYGKSLYVLLNNAVVVANIF
ncbi:MAG TPA: hypothetical protein VG962_06120 [Steroidobacteraceae bacterium]|nr:hypothetical protein [Steroidobacteraceae bacterium]